MDELSELHPGGVFLRRHALEHGYDDEDLRNGLKAGALERIRHGAYMKADGWRAASSVGRHLLACRAVLLSHGPGVALSHASAGAAAGLRLWDVDLSRIHLARLDGQSARHLNDVVHHVGSWGRLPLEEHHGMPTVGAAAAALGVAASSSVEAGVVTLDSLFHLGLADPQSALRLYRSLGTWPGSRRVQVSLRLAQPGSESVGESRLRFLCWLGHLPRPELQYVVRDQHGGLIGIADFAWPEYGVLGEFDGRVKFERFRRPGESPADVAVREKIREDRMREATGWVMIRFVWSDLADRRGTIDRMRRALHR